MQTYQKSKNAQNLIDRSGGRTNFRPISTGCKKLAAFTAIKALQCKKPHGMQIHLARRNISRRTVLSIEGAQIPTLEPINIVRTVLGIKVGGASAQLKTFHTASVCAS
jgi:hypothetical protein